MPVRLVSAEPSVFPYDFLHQSAAVLLLAVAGHVDAILFINAFLRLGGIDQPITGNVGPDIGIGIVVFVAQYVVATGDRVHRIFAQEGNDGVVERFGGVVAPSQVSGSM